MRSLNHPFFNEILYLYDIRTHTHTHIEFYGQKYVQVIDWEWDNNFSFRMYNKFLSRAGLDEFFY